MKISPINIEPIKQYETVNKYGDCLTAHGKQLNKKRLDHLRRVIREFNILISDVNEKGTWDGKWFDDKNSESWKKIERSLDGD